MMLAVLCVVVVVLWLLLSAVVKLDDIKQGVCRMSAVVDSLVAEVSAIRTVSDSSQALLDKLFALVQGGIDSGDLAKVQTALDDLKAEKDELAAAVTRNTPADPPPTP